MTWELTRLVFDDDDFDEDFFDTLLPSSSSLFLFDLYTRRTSDMM